MAEEVRAIILSDDDDEPVLGRYPTLDPQPVRSGARLQQLGSLVNSICAPLRGALASSRGPDGGRPGEAAGTSQLCTSLLGTSLLGKRERMDLTSPGTMTPGRSAPRLRHHQGVEIINILDDEEDDECGDGHADVMIVDKAPAGGPASGAAGAEAGASSPKRLHTTKPVLHPATPAAAAPPAAGAACLSPASTAASDVVADAVVFAAAAAEAALPMRSSDVAAAAEAAPGLHATAPELHVAEPAMEAEGAAPAILTAGDNAAGPSDTPATPADAEAGAAGAATAPPGGQSTAGPAAAGGLWSASLEAIISAAAAATAAAASYTAAAARGDTAAALPAAAAAACEDAADASKVQRAGAGVQAEPNTQLPNRGSPRAPAPRTCSLGLGPQLGRVLKHTTRAACSRAAALMRLVQLGLVADAASGARAGPQLGSGQAQQQQQLQLQEQRGPADAGSKADVVVIAGPAAEGTAGAAAAAATTAADAGVAAADGCAGATAVEVITLGGPDKGEAAMDIDAATPEVAAETQAVAAPEMGRADMGPEQVVASLMDLTSEDPMAVDELQPLGGDAGQLPAVSNSPAGNAGLDSTSIEDGAGPAATAAAATGSAAAAIASSEPAHRSSETPQRDSDDVCDPRAGGRQAVAPLLGDAGPEGVSLGKQQEATAALPTAPAKAGMAAFTLASPAAPTLAAQGGCSSQQQLERSLAKRTVKAALRACAWTVGASALWLMYVYGSPDDM